jgi:hypothetical protein
MDPCFRLQGEYPPDTVTMTGAETVEVEYSSWSCTGFDAEGAYETPLLPLTPARQVEMSVPIEDGASYAISSSQTGEGVSLGEGLTDEVTSVVVPQGSIGLGLRLCTEDGRCANYQVEPTE